MNDAALRQQLIHLLDWEDAHAGFDAVVDAVPRKIRAARPEGLQHSAWELLEHLRLAQRDILEFCVDADYRERKWPDDYWPDPAHVPTDAEWDESIRAFRADRDALKALASNTSIDLFAAIPHGDGQTYLRELLLVADHNAWHMGQLVLTRKALGAWG